MSSYQQIQFHIRGVVPLIIHNGQLADPLNPIVKEIKKVTKKKTKTDEDHEEIARLEWTGSFYLDEKDAPCIPGEVIEGFLIASAKKSKQGPVAKSGVLSEGNWSIIYDGPKDIAKMWKLGNKFRYAAIVKVGQSRVVRTRPIFREWELKFTVDYLPNVVDKEDIIKWVTDGSVIVGLCERRPKFGRFNVVSAT